MQVLKILFNLMYKAINLKLCLMLIRERANREGITTSQINEALRYASIYGS